MLTRIRSGDKNLELIQDNIDTALRPLQASALMASSQGTNLIQSQALLSGQDNLVAHKLARKPVIWIISDQDSQATLWSPITTQLNGASRDESFINLWTSANCTVSLFFA